MKDSLKITYIPVFMRQLAKLETGLQEEVMEKIALLKDAKTHQRLKVHKLHGRLANRYSFSVNYKTRVVFTYISKQEIALLAIGDHAVYDE